MFHRSTGFTRRQQISVVACALVLMLTMAFPAAAAPSRPDPDYTDFGDLPSDYPTVGGNRAVHSLGVSPLWLGACVDGEYDGQPSLDAMGDNTNSIYHTDPIYGDCQPPPIGDEDGVTRVAGKGSSGWTNGTVADGGGGAVEVTITGGPACLGAFFDFNRIPIVGDLQSVTLRDISGNAVTQPFAAGKYTFYFDIPSSTFTPSGPSQQPLYARFRVTSPVEGSCALSTAFSPTGPAPDGEVEDYRWNFGPNAVTLSGMTASSAASPLALPLGLVTLLGVLVGGIVLARRPV